MGDRAQVKIKNRKKSVYLYSHWRGTELANLVGKALARKQRWNDAEYLARIVFDTISEGQHGQETGFGIGTAPHEDLQHHLIVLDTDTAEVIFRPCESGKPDEGKELARVPFAKAAEGLDYPE